MKKEVDVLLAMDESNWSELSHAICMGIRKGLFGSNASDNDSFGDAVALHEIADAINNLADAVREIKGK